MAAGFGILGTVGLGLNITPRISSTTSDPTTTARHVEPVVVLKKPVSAAKGAPTTSDEESNEGPNGYPPS
jgi:hypothetical protein